MSGLVERLEQRIGNRGVKAAKLVVGALVGGLGGYTYYALVGCSTGGCPITSDPIVATAWGGLIGGFTISGI